MRRKRGECCLEDQVPYGGGGGGDGLVISSPGTEMAGWTRCAYVMYYVARVSAPGRRVILWTPFAGLLPQSQY
jgi:hypothetical protein